MNWLRHKKTAVIYPFDDILSNHRHIEKYNPTKSELTQLKKQFKMVELNEEKELSQDWLAKIENLTGVPTPIIKIMKAILSLEQDNEEHFNSLGLPVNAALEGIMNKKIHWKHRDRAISVLKEIGYEIKSRGNNPESS